MMKKWLFLSLVLIGCREEGDMRRMIGKRPVVDRVIWVNQSSHAIRMTAQGKNNLDVSLPFGEPYLFSGNYNLDQSSFYWPTPLDLLDFTRMDIYFDDDIHVPYVLMESENFQNFLKPLTDYPSEMSVTVPNHYVITSAEAGKDEMTSYYIETWTYTFTNADYEAAREWAARRKSSK